MEVTRPMDNEDAVQNAKLSDLTIWRCTECNEDGSFPSGKSAHENFHGHETEWYTPHHHDDE